MSLPLKVALACAGVLSAATIVDAGSCRPSVPRHAAVRRAKNDAAAFAVPVATVAVAFQPAFFYSYREVSPTYQAPTKTAALEVDERGPRSAESILRVNCLKCHQGDAPRVGLRLFAADGGLERLLPRRAILEMAAPDANGVVRMPPGDARKLSDEELDILQQWAEPPRDLKY